MFCRGARMVYAVGDTRIFRSMSGEAEVEEGIKEGAKEGGGGEREGGRVEGPFTGRFASGN